MNAATFHGNSPLHFAAGLGNRTEMAGLLLARRDINVNAVNEHRNTPLMIACQRGHADAVVTFLYISKLFPVRELHP